MSTTFLTALVVMFAQPADEELARAEKTLRDARIATDGPGLIGFFKARTPTPADRERIVTCVRQLGDESFDVRDQASKDLVAAGRWALPYLRPALKDADVERARRARECVAVIEKVPHVEQMTAAGRVLAARKPDGAAAALLAYLPFADDEYLEDSLMAASLVVVGLDGGKPAADVLAASADREPLRRAAVAHVLGRAAPEHRKPLAALVKDADARVRYHAAVGLLRTGDRAGGKALLALLADGPPSLAWRAEDMLLRVAGDQPPKITLAKQDDDGRRKWRTEWEAWWDGNIAKIDLARINFDDGSLGLTVFCGDEKIGESPGFVYAVNRSGNVVWKIEGINSPADCHLLPGGRILVAQNWHSKVTEHDRSGKVLLELTLPEKPVSCERLPNGNTFVATYHSLHEFTPDGKEVFAHKASSMLHGGYKLRDGHMLTVDTTGNIEELDAKGERVHRFAPERHASGAGAWASVEVLQNGNYLIALSGSGRVIETDRMGKIVWEAEVNSPTSASRLRNGHTLVSSVDGGFVVELDGMGKEVWRSPAWCRAFRVRRY
jgi:hypothetical protein